MVYEEGLYAGVDYNLTLCPLQSRLQHIYHGQPYAIVDLNPMPESTLSPRHGLLIWPWEEDGIIERSTSPWSAYIFQVLQNRLCGSSGAAILK
jgi:hypothetical protein